MILVPFPREGEPDYSQDDVKALQGNLGQFLPQYWSQVRVDPIFGRQSQQAVGLRVKPLGAAVHAMSLFPDLKPTSWTQASEL